jgi:hypothetical protein
MGKLWVMGRNSLGTRSVPTKRYGLSRVMGYEGYGLRGIRLYPEPTSRTLALIFNLAVLSFPKSAALS